LEWLLIVRFIHNHQALLFIFVSAASAHIESAKVKVEPIADLLEGVSAVFCYPRCYPRAISGLLESCEVKKSPGTLGSRASRTGRLYVWET
jgi:hypothetical protein